MMDLEYQINLVKVPVKDFSRAARFYRETLGLKEDFAVAEYGWAQYSTGSIPLCIYEVGKGGGDGVPGNDTGIHLSVTDPIAAHKAVKERSEYPVGDVFSSADGGLFFTVYDPDGNSLKIGQNQD
jgi:catechol 2,3-dioxygenase-like lactoylglutathione lyase family enzyme